MCKTKMFKELNVNVNLCYKGGRLQNPDPKTNKLKYALIASNNSNLPGNVLVLGEPKLMRECLLKICLLICVYYRGRGSVPVHIGSIEENNR